MTTAIHYARAIDRHSAHLDALNIDQGELMLELLYRADSKGDGVPCGSGWISKRKKCSQKGAEQLKAALKAGDKGALARVASTRKKVADRNKLKREVAADRGKKAMDVKGSKKADKPARLEVLQNSLKKKQAEFDRRIEDHFSTVKQANGQPLNDKRNGQSTLRKWDRQNDALRSLKEGIEKTKNAIEKEQYKVQGVEEVLGSAPKSIVKMVEDGTLKQWRRNPNTFFVDGVDKARIVWDEKKKQVAHRYLRDITDPDQWKKFARTFNALASEINEPSKK